MRTLRKRRGRNGSSRRSGSARAGRTSRAGGRRWLGVALLVMGGVAVVLASGLGGLIAERYIVPLYRSVTENGITGLFEGDGMPAPSPSPTPSPMLSPGERADITVPGMPLYAVQMGAFSTEAAAQGEAESMKARGGAGFILRDGERYRVLAAAYRTADDARSVRDNLKQAQGIESYVYTAICPMPAGPSPRRRNAGRS